MREYPAYGRTIAACIVRGQKPICVGVLLSSRWRYFDHVAKVCIKPEDWALGRYEFGYLRGLHVVAVAGDDCQDAQLGELLFDLMRVGPRLVWVYAASGQKLYDGEHAMEVANWVHALGAKVEWPLLKAARSTMELAEVAAARAWRHEYDAITSRRGDEAAVEFSLLEWKLKDQVRQQFSAPFQENGEPAAA